MSSEPVERLTSQLLDPRFVFNLDGLLDSVIALFNDCNYPVLKRIRNIETFLEKNEQLIKLLLGCRISNIDFHPIKVIGRGAFGEVQLVRNVQTSQVFAMKLLDKDKMIGRSESAFFWEERDIMAYSNSDWIVKLHYAFQDPRFLYMVMEFMPGGDMVNLMANHDIPEEWAQFYTAELVLALDAIHNLGYIHRDVKPDNMLISASGHIKLADFGTCVKMNSDGLVRCSTAVGTPDYISPEVLRSQGGECVYGREVDWWSVGVVLYELLVGEPPFYADSLSKTYSRIMDPNKQLKFPSDVKISENARDIIRKFLSEPNVRLGRDGVLAIKLHPFFVNRKWDFETIKNSTPPYVPQLSGDDDTSHFEDVDAGPVSSENFQIPKAFTGSQLPFIGFTYSNDYGPLEAIRKKIEQQPKKLATVVNLNEIEQIKLEKKVVENKMKDLQKELDTNNKFILDLQQKLEQKQRSHRHVEEAFLELQRDKSSLESELRQVLQRHELEYKSLNTAAAERESELLTTIRKMQEQESNLKAKIRQQEEEILQIRKHSHGPMGLAPVNSSLSSAVSTSSLASNTNSFPSGLHNGSILTTSTDLESLNRDQLIQRCQREIKMKEQAVQKLLAMGIQKGINDDLSGRANTKKRKKRQDEKRVRDMVEFQLEQERKKYLQKIKETEDNLQYLIQELGSEQNKNVELNQKLQMYLSNGELPRDLTHDHYICRCRVLPRRRLLAGQHLLNNGTDDD